MPDLTYPDATGAARGDLRWAGIIGGAFFLGLTAAFLPFPFAAGGASSRMPVRAAVPAGAPIGKA